MATGLEHASGKVTIVLTGFGYTRYNDPIKTKRSILEALKKDLQDVRGIDNYLDDDLIIVTTEEE